MRKQNKTTAEHAARPLTVVRGSTGPRTAQGKGRSKNNALKHGIFAKVVVLPGESPAEFDALLNGLRNDFQPVGTLEEVLVEKLSALLWRNRRLFVAEGAEIGAGGTEFVQWDEEQRQLEEVNKIWHVDRNGALLQKIANPGTLERCLQLLRELMDLIRKDLVPQDPVYKEYFGRIMTILYGDRAAQHRDALFDTVWRDLMLVYEWEIGLPELEHCKIKSLVALVREIRRLEQYKTKQKKIQFGRMKLESVRRNVPDAPQSDRLLRYETGLERAIDRVLNQLERCQRMRLGQPVPPQINVSVSS
jgi:hypothetical protein